MSLEQPSPLRYVPSIATGHSRVVCTVCGRSFATEGDLYRHEEGAIQDESRHAQARYRRENGPWEDDSCQK